MDSFKSVRRRSHQRYTLQGSSSSARLQESPQQAFPLLDISFGGLCLESTRPYRVGSIQDLVLELRGLLNDSVSVKGIVSWVGHIGERWRCGVEVLESNKAWMGPKDGE